MTRPPSRAAARLLALLEVPALAAVPLVLGVCAYFQVEQGALLTVVVAFAAVGVFFASFEASRPALRQIMPTVRVGRGAGRRTAASRPRIRMYRVEGLRKASPTIVEPIARPRNSVTVLAISFDDALVRRSTTPDSFIRLPSISMPISGVANGTSVPTTMVTMIGNRMRVRWLISRLV